MNNYTDMTDEEYDALDEELTVNPPKIISNGNDWLSQREIRISGLKNMTVQYLLTKAKADKKSPVQIIDELVSEKLAAAV
ncbi:MAG: hypothetical protein LBG94_01450 [Treponema sp.]|jgi:hypothetical protein|nr:hypothetical protein [Treponema sp.]